MWGEWGGGKRRSGKEGGVYVISTAFTMSGGTISGNTATSGGGVYVASGGTYANTGDGSFSGNSPDTVYHAP